MFLFRLMTLLMDFHKIFNKRCGFSGYPSAELSIPYSR